MKYLVAALEVTAPSFSSSVSYRYTLRVYCRRYSYAIQMHPKIRRGEIDPTQNLGVLANEFLEFYGKYFNFSDVGISVLEGGTYFTKESRGWGDPTRRFLLSIEDPCDTGETNIIILRGYF
jgi:DNA polymerase sigma